MACFQTKVPQDFNFRNVNHISYRSYYHPSSYCCHRLSLILVPTHTKGPKHHQACPFFYVPLKRIKFISPSPGWFRIDSVFQTSSHWGDWRTGRGEKRWAWLALEMGCSADDWAGVTRGPWTWAYPGVDTRSRESKPPCVTAVTHQHCLPRGMPRTFSQ